MNQLLGFFHLDNDGDILDVDQHILPAWLVVAPSSKVYTVSTVLFYKYKQANSGVKKFMSHVSMLFPTKVSVKLANDNMGNAQVLEIILCCFPN